MPSWNRVIVRPARYPALVCLLAAGGCATLPDNYSTTCAEASRPAIALAPDGKTARLQLDVLTYNIEGLAWPARSGRGPFLRQIGAKLAELRARGTAPDIVMFQEMFSHAASTAVIAAGYPSLVAGPKRTQRRAAPRAGQVPGSRKWKKGEIGIHFATGGLAIASRYPILADTAEPYGKKSCAGLDCLSNKGVLFARIAIPGLPDPVDLFNTHMNSQRASKVSVERRDTSHEVQARELKTFIEAVGTAEVPFLLAGDFNMRGSDARFQAFNPTSRSHLVHSHCLENAGVCDVKISWDGDAPWMDTQDLQFFASGSRVSIRPVRVEAMFDGSDGSPRLSDHDGFRVAYELSWPVEAKTSAWSCGAGASAVSGG